MGTTKGRADLVVNWVGNSTSLTLGKLPSSGEVLYVRLWTRFDDQWKYRDHRYTAATMQASASCWDQYADVAYEFRSWLCPEDDYETVRVYGSSYSPSGGTQIEVQSARGRFVFQVSGRCPVQQRVVAYTPGTWGADTRFPDFPSCRVLGARRSF